MQHRAPSHSEAIGPLAFATAPEQRGAPMAPACGAQAFTVDPKLAGPARQHTA